MGAPGEKKLQTRNNFTFRERMYRGNEYKSHDGESCSWFDLLHQDWGKTLIPSNPQFRSLRVKVIINNTKKNNWYMLTLTLHLADELRNQKRAPYNLKHVLRVN